jgi:hypothetical protein
MATACVEWTKAKTKAGYGLRGVGGGKLKYVHRIAMEEKLGRILDSKEVVMHSCDNPSCYNIEHLIVGSQADNHADMVSKNRMAKGFRLPQTRLSEEDVLRIRELRESGERTKDIAELFSVHQSHISKITAGSRRIA